MKPVTVSSSSTAPCGSPAASHARSTCSASERAAGFRLDRRALLIGSAAAALGLAPGRLLAQSGGARRFALIREGSEIGEHTLAATISGDALTMAIRIVIDVRVLGISFYSYDHRNEETWVGGVFQGLVSKTDDDGEADFADVKRNGDKLVMRGSDFTGDLPSDAVPTTYWNHANFASKNWFSSQSGKPLRLNFAQDREGALERWNVSGDFATVLLYDDTKEWRGCRFDGQGVEIAYRETAPGQAFAPFARRA